MAWFGEGAVNLVRYNSTFKMILFKTTVSIDPLKLFYILKVIFLFVLC